MPIAIYLRKEAAINRFRAVIIGALNSRWGTHATLCSGFFQEEAGGYEASQEARFIAGAKKLSELKTLGVYNGLWMDRYRAFVDSLRKGGVRVAAFKIRRARWHAKVFLLHRKSEPVLGIIGSSNITRPAFSTSAPCNWECDVVIWPDVPAPRETLVRQLAVGEERLGHDVILADYDPEKNGGLTIEDRLTQLQSELDQQTSPESSDEF